MKSSSNKITVKLIKRPCKSCSRSFWVMDTSLSFHCGVPCRTFGDSPHRRPVQVDCKMVTIDLSALKINPKTERHGASINIDW